MRINAKYNPKSFTGIYLITLISAVLSYFFIPLGNPRPFNATDFVIWIIIGNICGFVLAAAVSLILRRQYLLYDSGMLTYQGPIAKKKIDINQITSIKFDFESKGSVNIISSVNDIELIANNFHLNELSKFLLSLMNINQNITTDEYTKAILARDVNSWLVREEPIIKLIRQARVLFGFLILIGITLYFINEAYTIFYLE